MGSRSRRGRRPRRIWKPAPRMAKLIDLPPELIERISLSLHPTTVRALRCVSRYLSEALSTERVCRRLLYYPERLYERDVLSGSTAAGVAEVVADLSAGRLARSQAYHKLQHARLRLCMDKQFDPCGEIPLPSQSVISDMVDDHGEHWVFVHEYDSQVKLHIWNITRQPRVHDIVVLSREGFKILPLPHGYVLVEETNLTVAIYKFANPEYRFHFLYRFCYKDSEVMPPSTPAPQDYFPGSESAVVGDLFVACDRNVPSIKTFSLHIWRLSDGIKLDEVLFPAEADDENVYFTCLYPGYKSNLVLVLNYIKLNDRRGKVYIFNIQARRFTHTLDEFARIYRTYIYGDCYMYRDKLCFITCYFEQSIFSLTAATAGTALAGGQRCKKIKQEENTTAVFMEAKMIVQNRKGVLVVDLEDDSLPEQQVTCDGWSVLSFIEPKLLIITDDYSVKIVTLDGTVIYFGENLNTDPYRRDVHYCNVRPRYPAKIVLLSDNKLLLLSP